MPNHPIRLEETDSEYLLYIHASQKMRARRIEGKRWDAARKCWVYPHTVPIYRSLVAEFGDELEDLTTTSRRVAGEWLAEEEPPTAPLKTETGPQSEEGGDHATPDLGASAAGRDALLLELAAQNGQLQAELGYIRQEREQLEADMHTLRAELEELRASRDRSTTAADTGLRKRVRDLEALVETHSTQAKRHVDEIQRLREELATVQKENARLKSAPQVPARAPDFSAQVFELALSAADQDKEFSEQMRNRRLDAQLPLVLNGLLVTLIERIIPPGDRSENLGAMLKVAQDKNFLTAEQLDLAHIVRKQRNVVAHVDLSPSSLQARSVITLFASALLWPELTEIIRQRFRRKP